MGHFTAFVPAAGRTTKTLQRQPQQVVGYPLCQQKYGFGERSKLHAVSLAGLPRAIHRNILRNAGAVGVGPTAIVGLAALFIGFFVGRLSKNRKASGSRLSNFDEDEKAFSIPNENFGDPDAYNRPEDGVTPRWLNYALARMWALFQKNTKRLINDVIQPVLDETEKPDFVKAVRITSFTPGRQSPYLRALRRLPSRALAEVQYSVQAIFSSTSVFTFEVDVEFLKEALKLTIPVTLRNLDVDAVAWSSFSLAPYEPFCTGVQYALLERPKLAFDMDIAGVIPITATPILRSFFYRVVTKEIPKEFLYPKTVSLDFTPEIIAEAKKAVTKRLQDLSSLTEDQLKESFPEQWALFDSMDLDNGGRLSPVELFAGLKDWGYTAQDASDGFERLDLNQDKEISFLEFCQMWPTLESSFVPNRYQGILAVFVRGAEDLARPLVGIADPIVRMKLSSGKEVTTKRDSKNMSGGTGCPIWNESFEFNCVSPEEESLELVITDESRWAWYGPKAGKEIGKVTIPLASFAKKPNQQLKVKVEPQGLLRINLSYADFVTEAAETEKSKP